MRITIADRETAEALAPTIKRGTLTVISITDPRAPLPEFPGAMVARFQFLDLESGSGEGPTQEIAAQLALAIRSLKTERVIIHCEYGQSRSAAVAMAAKFWHQCELDFKGDIYPNTRLARLLDDELGFDGGLTKAAVMINSRHALGTN